MAFRKSIYASVDSDKASGDDVFLLHHAKRNNLGIAFVKEQRAIVYTEPKATLFKAFSTAKALGSQKLHIQRQRRSIRILVGFFNQLVFIVPFTHR